MLGRRLALVLFFLGVALLAQPCGATPTPFQWEYTGSLNTARSLHTATLLPDGKVLVVGGNPNAIASAELYDPAPGTTGTWTFTGSLNTARYYHTATLLSDGRVLVAGGFNSGSLASAELYDPATGTWTYTGSLNVGRYNHTATLLFDGKVLVTGSFPSVASAELYDPATGTWTYTGSLNVDRYNHTATLLSDGRVLVVGGYNGGGVPYYLASAELYDPATGNWTRTGSLNWGRELHTATLLSNGEVLAAGGKLGAHTLASAELYDPVTGTWTVTDSLDTDRDIHAATLLDNGRVLVAGGAPWLEGSLASAELYGPGIVVDGRGTVDNLGDEVTFNFRANHAGHSGIFGLFSFCDSTAGVCASKARIRDLSINGNTAEFSGPARLEDGTNVTFTVSVTDNGEPGTSDTISISLSTGYLAGGTLTTGDIRIQ